MSDNKSNIVLPHDAESSSIDTVSSNEEVLECKKSKFRKFTRTFLFTLLFIFLAPMFVLFFLYVVPGIQEFGKGRNRVEVNDTVFKQQPTYKKQIGILVKEYQKVERKLSSFTPAQPYLIISTTNNRFFLYQNKQMVREGYCSSGSYILLLTEGPKRWIFKTPKGKFRILTKMVDPVWKKPDWAFVEEGLPIPPPNDDSRFEYGVLGDYALEIGDGYMIHGTIYKRFLGMPVTHGCIRLNDDDLKVIYKTLDFGSKVYIY